jgi:glyoxylase-like metal-dependent hydrolase (beta-lactamase superfamily II)
MGAQAGDTIAGLHSTFHQTSARGDSMVLSRRRFLNSTGALGAAAIGVAALGGCASASGGPKVSMPSAGAMRASFGTATAVSISDGSATRPLDANFVRNAPLATVQAALREQGLSTETLDVPFTPLVVEIGSQRVLIDTGNGEFGPPTTGKTVENLTHAGIPPASITAVVISHFHGDHINGLRNKAGALAYPNAKIYVPAPEWAWWMDDARMNAAPEAMRGGFAGARRVFAPIASSVVRFDPGSELLPGLRSMPAYGHTPGHTVFVVDGGGANKLMYWADTTNVAPLFVRNPDWAVVFDMDPEAARQTRRRLAEMVIAQNMLLAGFHLPSPAVGRLAKRGDGYAFTPLTT